MDWDDVRVFCAVAEAPTLSAAARRLTTSVATVARRITALEEALGVRLLDRARQGVTLTTHGRALVTRAAAASGAMDGVQRLALALRANAWPDPIRVSATEPIIGDILAPALPRLLAVAPDVRIDLSVTTQVVSLAGREADVAVRMFRPVGDSLVIRRLPPFELALFASRSYLAGRRREAIDLTRERLIGYDDTHGRIAELAWMEAAGLARAAAVRSSSTRALLHAAVAGVGVALLPRMLARGAPTLVEIPPPIPIPKRPAWLATHRDLRRAHPVRVVRDWIVEAIEAAQRAR